MRTISVVLTASALLLGIPSLAHAQLRAYEIHRRGMLHQTVFNTGELGRAYDQGRGGSTPGLPSLEYPGKASVIIDAIQYNGQYNSFGGGIHAAANPADTTVRLYAFCGAAGSSSPETVVGVWSFPISVSRTENYPVLSSGDLNPSYNPDEAEEIITSKWATPLGLTMTRVSRVWSHPDYDDFIIYELEVENTGDRDGIPGTIESTAQLNEVFIGIAQGFTPSMLGYERTFNRWLYADYEANDLYARFDRMRWLNYALDRDGKPDPAYYSSWAESGANGGGLLSPQAVGFATLYYDTDFLATDEQTSLFVASDDTANVWDANGKLKQPFLNRLETSNMRTSKTQPYYDIALNRKNNPYRNLAIFGPDWVGRGSFNVRQSQKNGVGRMIVFGPYILPHGAKIRFAWAEVAGYGAARLAETQAGLRDEGGSCGELCGEPAPDYSFWPVPNWEQTISYGLYLQTTFGSNYLSQYSLPDYVNSDVVTIREVSDRAIQTYTGQELVDHDTLQYWPHDGPDRGVYRIPVTLPAPAITIENTALAQNRIHWGPQVEAFTHPRMSGSFSHYELYKAASYIGPWTRLDSVGIGDPRYFTGGIYEFLDPNTRVGESFYYSLISVSTDGSTSGRTNITFHQTQLGGTDTNEKVTVVPNPFFVRSGFSGTTPSGADASTKIGFYNLPKVCTIRIFSYAGQLIETLTHDSGDYSTEYFQVTRNNQTMASGLYFFVVETPDGKVTHGKFVVIH